MFDRMMIHVKDLDTAKKSVRYGTESLTSKPYETLEATCTDAIYHRVPRYVAVEFDIFLRLSIADSNDTSGAGGWITWEPEGL